MGYETNRFVGFVNGPDALHAPNRRPPTPYVRRYVDFVIELAEPLYHLPQMGPLRRWFFRSFQREETR